MDDLLTFYADELIPALLRGLGMTFQLIIPSALLGFLFGCLVGALRVYGAKPVAKAADFYVSIFRGTPLVCQLFIWYFGLPHLGVYLSPYVASVTAFAFCSAAYHSEYIRGGLLSVRRGQLLAAQALGFTRMQSILSVVLPQGLRRAAPGCGNEVVYLIKYSSLAYIVTCLELTGEGKSVASMSFRYTEVFITIGAIYLLLVTVATYGLGVLEKRLSLPGFELHKS